MPTRVILALAAVLAAAAVGLGAYSAHGLEARLQSAGHEANLAERLHWFATGVHYHMYHAFALALVALFAGERLGGATWVAGIGFLLGITLFSGSLYLMALGPDSWRRLGAVVPLGGVAYITGWLAFAWSAWWR